MKNEQFSDDKAVSMMGSDAIIFMLLKREYFETFTPKQVADARRSSEVLVALSFDSRRISERRSRERSALRWRGHGFRAYLSLSQS